MREEIGRQFTSVSLLPPDGAGLAVERTCHDWAKSRSPLHLLNQSQQLYIVDPRPFREQPQPFWLGCHYSHVLCTQSLCNVKARHTLLGPTSCDFFILLETRLFHSVRKS
jgi:hypothetical protein